MTDLKETRTEANLLEAFAGESQANRRYLAFASKAEQEGHMQVAKLFRAAAAAETIHALAHLRVVGGVGETADNLRDAIAGETHEFTAMYPEMIAVAAEENIAMAKRSFELANTVEKIHAELYQQALAQLGNNPEVDYYVCKVCGNTLEGAPGGACEICGAGVNAFQLIE